MKNLNPIGTLLISFLFLMPPLLTAQNYSKVFLQKQHRMLDCKKMDVNHENFFSTYREKMGLSVESEMRLEKNILGSNEYEHFKYQQFYKNIPVYRSAYTLHSKNGKVQLASGYYLPKIELSILPALGEASAVESAIQAMGASYYTFNDPSISDFQKTEKPGAELVIVDAAYPQASEVYVLAYKVHLSSTQPLDKKELLIDAHTGKLLFDLPLMHKQSVPATVQTKFYGEQTITVDSVAPNEFYLRDPSRNNNTTRHVDGYVWRDNDNTWNLANENEDEVALDAHYCTEKFHDYLIEKFNWNGLDGNGVPMNAVVKLGNTINAFWNGEAAHFFDGDCHHGPLTTLEVVAHEFAHGLTQYTSDLVYSSESGAINESMSDIFGKALEFHVEPQNFSWDLGHSFIETIYPESFRSFTNPNDREHPKFYRGEYWFDGGGVHTNSSVGNHWFYNLVVGGSGNNEIGEPYDITGIGWEDAMQIVFKTQTTYLAPNSTYNDYFNFSLMAAEEIFGANATQIDQVREAWKVVGLPAETASIENDLSVGFNQRFQNTCIDGGFHELGVTVSNNGAQDYDPVQGEATVTISYNGEDRVITLMDTILAGEVVEIIVDDFIFFDMEGFAFIQGQLFWQNDEEFMNNSAFAFVDNLIIQGRDLEIFTTFSPRNCFNNKHIVNFNLINQSCNSLDEGTKIEVLLRNSNAGFQWNNTYVLEADLGSGNRVTFTEEIELEVGEYESEVSLADDQNANNNFSTDVILGRETITENYTNPFDTDDIYFVKSDPFSNIIQNYDGNNTLVFSGDNGISTRIHCPEAEDNLESNGSYVKSITTCVNFSEYENTKLSFDLTQYRNDMDVEYEELLEVASVFKMLWRTETNELEEVFFNLEEGVTTNFEFELPAYFKGEVMFESYAGTGDVFSQNALDFDVNLLDNVIIEEVLVSTRDFKEIPVTISPNPSSGTFIIEHPEVPKSMDLYSIHGQFIKHFDSPFTLDKLDLSSHSNGIYLLTIDYGDLGKTTKRLVKQ